MSSEIASGKCQSSQQHPGRLRSRGRLFAKFALLLGSLTLTLLVIEIGLHWAGAQPPTATVFGTFFEYSPNTSWRGKPNAAGRFKTSNFDAFTSHDADGFRRCNIDAPIASDATSSQCVVWVLGDSMVWGWGVEDGKTCVDFLNESSRLTGYGAKYRNLGHPGFSSLQEYLLLKELLTAGYKPNQVLVAYCDNDLTENLDEQGERPYLRITAETPEIMNHPVARSRLRDFSWWMKSHCRSWNFVSYYWASWQHQRRHRRDLKAAAAAEVAAANKKLTTPNGAAESANSVEEDAVPTEQRLALRYSYQLMRDLCYEHGISFAVVSDFRPQKTLRNTCDELSIQLLDISDALSRNKNSLDESRPRHFQTDPHLTEFGNQLMAEGIEAELRRNFTHKYRKWLLSRPTPQRRN